MTEIVSIILLGLAAGTMSGLIGIGGGVILVPGLVYLIGKDQHMAQGTSLAMMIAPIGLLSAWTYYGKGHVDFRVAAILCAGFFVGSFFGAKIAVGLDAITLKRVFGVALLLISLKMITGK